VEGGLVGLGGFGGFTTGGTTTGGTTGGGVTVGGTTAGGGTTGKTTGGTTTVTGTPTVTITGVDFTGGFAGVPGPAGPVGFEVGGVDGVDDVDPGLVVVDGVTEPATVGVGFTEGVGTPAAPGLRSVGTTISELPPDWVGDPKLEPATG
jgi:hypothetical protein